MSLITRCPACGTMFKVVADQLKISQGWVRCGQCSEVFDAAAYLQPRVSPQAPPPPSPAADKLPLPATFADSATDDEAVTPFASLLVAPEVETPVAAAAPAAEPAPVPEPEPEPEPEPPVAALSVPEVQVSMPPDLAADVFAASVSLDVSVQAELPPAAATAAATFDDSLAPEPSLQDVSFVRDARRQAFWRQPAMRWSLSAGALLLLLLLALQVAVFQRNTLAVRQPSLHSALQSLCGYLGCKIEPLRQIESMVIDSSSFYKIAPDAYRLKVVIKNTSALALAMPSVELTLTDSQDQALLRRVLTPAELGAPAAPVAAGAQFAGTIDMAIADPAAPAPAASASASAAKAPAPLRIAGYNLLAFYP